MRTIHKGDILKIGDHLLWRNEGERLKTLGATSVVVITRYGSIPWVPWKDFFLDIPGTDVDQYMDIDSIRRNSKLLEIEKEPEYFL